MARGTINDLLALRSRRNAASYAWELMQDGRPVEARVKGQVMSSGATQLLNAALAGYGPAFLPEHLAKPLVTAGRCAG
jgi:DNA-binding transcriptional LysR family regulator